MYPMTQIPPAKYKLNNFAWFLPWMMIGLMTPAREKLLAAASAVPESAAALARKAGVSANGVFSGVGETEGFAKNEGAVPVAGFRMTPAREKLLAAAPYLVD